MKKESKMALKKSKYTYENKEAKTDCKAKVKPSSSFEQSPDIAD